MEKVNQIFLLIILISSSIYGQEKKIPLHDLKFSYEIEKELAEETLRKTTAAYYYSYLGNYEQALKHYELHLDWGLDSISTRDSIDFLQYQPVDAYDFLEEKTKEEQIVIISEAHHKPQHRIFTRKLLKSLYQNGFRYLGLETMSPSYGDTTQFLMDTQLSERGFPLNSPMTGYYTREPQMANLVRTALELGFEIFGYESTERKKERDLQQAININRFIDAHPKGKVVIHCGWYHAIESDYPKRKSDNYMAYHLKRMTGIDPLTIYQDALSEKQILPESPLYKMVKAESTSVLVNKEGTIFNGIDNRNHFDILIYHPRTKYLKNRPNWLLDIKGNKAVKIKKRKISKIQYPIIVKAFANKENRNATPIDQIELKDRKDSTPLVLKKGIYRMLLIDKDRNEVEYIKKVK